MIFGRSAAGGVQRAGFERMVAEVCLGKVGTVARARPRGSPQQPGLAATKSPSKTSSLKPMASVPGAAERVDPDDNSRALRDFFVWLSWQPGFKSPIRREISTISIVR